MNTERISAVATQWIDGFDHGAHRAIAAWREGGERLGELARARWDTAFEQSRDRLSEETQRNAGRAQQAFGALYGKGIALGASGADVAVTTVTQVARVAIERAAGHAAAWQQSRG